MKHQALLLASLANFAIAGTVIAGSQQQQQKGLEDDPATLVVIDVEEGQEGKSEGKAFLYQIKLDHGIPLNGDRTIDDQKLDEEGRQILATAIKIRIDNRQFNEKDVPKGVRQEFKRAEAFGKLAWKFYIPVEELVSEHGPLTEFQRPYRRGYYGYGYGRNYGLGRYGYYGSYGRRYGYNPIYRGYYRDPYGYGYGRYYHGRYGRWDDRRWRGRYRD